MVRLHPSSPSRVVVEMYREEPTIYLDHWAMREMSSRPTLRDRFLAAFETRGTLLFSSVHIAELAKNTGRSTDAIRSFLDAVGPHWMVTLADPIEVIRRENAWTVTSRRAPFVADTFFKTSGFLVRLSEGPVSLSHIVDMVRDEGSDAILANLTSSVQTLVANLNRFRQEYRANSGILSTTFPAQMFDKRYPTRFVFHQLMRSLITTQVKLSPNHIADFFHAVVPLAYAQIVVLDKHWATQAENLHLPENWVRIFKKSNLEDCFELIEQMPSVRGNGAV